MRRFVIAASLLVCGTLHAQLPIEHYIGALERIHSLLATKQLDAAKAEAVALAGKEIVSSRGKFHADDSLLDAIRQARGADPILLNRIALTVDELRRTGAPGTPPDPKLLQQVAAEQDVPELAPGGEINTNVVPQVPLSERIATAIVEMFRWIGKKVADLIDWFLDLFPRRSFQRPDGTPNLRWIVIGVVTLIVLIILVLAIEVARRSRRDRENVVTSTAPIRSERDDDPLSRGATEWERYAAQLAGAGHFREAIRAWYHAVLVTSYAAGALHFRKGRTNWEYIASLAPSMAWRADFIRLTQRFEQEWYGADQSTRDAFDDCSAHARRILEQLRLRGAA
ncbi:MAG TPA: DUF4129 domain-containing protein [Thermoanaerobaculia bacterium]|nr:DUF4129 domain-containing protein [Thermoanaerobaculia bacterium]